MKKKSTSQSAFFNLRVLAALFVGMTGLSLALFAANPFARGTAAPAVKGKQNYVLGQSTNISILPPGFDCAKIRQLGIDRQENLHAGLVMLACGQGRGGTPPLNVRLQKFVQSLLPSPLAYGGSDVNLVTGTETFPNTTQSETFTTANPDDPDQVVVAFNDSRGAPSNNFSGAAVSTDGGLTFTRITNASGQSPFTNTFGDPVVLYHSPSGTWVTAWLDGGCGGQGIGGYRSTNPSDPNSWTHYCAHNNTQDDRESGWADNNPSSPFFGRMYISWNDFNVGGGALSATFSTDGGATWHSPVTVSNTGIFHRDVQITGDLAGSGAIYVASMDEGGGNFPHNDTNLIFKSTDGGATWANTYTGATSFPGPGVVACSANTYFSCMFTDNGGYWRHEGWGQPAAVNNFVHLVYSQHGTGSDPGDVYYIRSTDGGVTFGAPMKLNTDSTTRPQWQPNLSVSPSGTLLATWYDARDSASCTEGNSSVPCYRMYSRKSNDNGATWLADDTLSDVVSPLAAEQDPNIFSNYAGDYDYGSAIGTKHLTSWMDGRNAINSQSQQDAFTDRELVGFSVTTTDPACGSLVTGTAPVDFIVHLSDPVDTNTVDAGDFTVNGTQADSFTLNPDNTQITFSFNTSPVVQGENTMHIPAGAFNQASNGHPVLEFQCTFRYGVTQLTVTDTVPPVGGTFTPPAPGTYTYDVNWNEAVDPASVQDTDLQLSGNTGATVTGHSVSGDNLTTTFTLNIPFGGSLTAHIAAGAITDTFGNPNADFSGNYTVSGCPPSQYTITEGTDTIVPGTDDTGNHTDDGTTFIALPFSFQLYDQSYNGVNVSSNGNAQFVTTDIDWVAACLPWAAHDFTIFPLWTDQCTGDCFNVTCTGCGIFTSTTGSEPNRIFNIEWRTAPYNSGATGPTMDYEVRLYESSGSLRFDVVYGAINAPGEAQMFVGGVQGNSGAGFFTQDFCNPSGSPPPGNVSATYEIPPCGATPTPTPTVTPTVTPSATPTATPRVTPTPRARPTPHPRPTP